MRVSPKPVWISVVCAWLALTLAAQQGKPGNSSGQRPTAQPSPSSQSEGLTIVNDSTLPKTFPHDTYVVHLLTQGSSVPPLRWKAESGKLPPGIELQENFLRGVAVQAGTFQFVLSVTDSNNPAQVAKKQFVLEVQEALSLVWKTVAHVNGNRIEGNVEVSNSTKDDIDLTFVVLAVAENGRATAIGYQHFPLRRGMMGQRIDFGDTLPNGAYEVHVDAVGEVSERNVIYRRRLQTPSVLQVSVAP